MTGGWLYFFVVTLYGAVLPCTYGRVSGGHLKWMFDAKSGYSPYNSTFVPAVLRGLRAGDERVAVLSKTVNGNWAVDGLKIENGEQVIEIPSLTLILIEILVL